VEDTYDNPVILNGTYYNDKLVEQERKNDRNIALHSPVTQHHSVTPETEQSKGSSTYSTRLNATTHAQNDDKLVEQEENRNDGNIALHSQVTQHHSVTPETEQSEGYSTFDTTTRETNVEEQIEEQKTNIASDSLVKQDELIEGPGNECQKSDSTFAETAHAREGSEKMDHNLTNHDRQERGKPMWDSNFDSVGNALENETLQGACAENGPAENQESQKCISSEQTTGLETNIHSKNEELERNGVQDSSIKAGDSDGILPSINTMNTTRAGFDQQNGQTTEDIEEPLTQSEDS
jgi:hypothetical protein